MKFNLILTIFLVKISFLHAWSYSEQDKWPAMYCQNAVAQSPIDIVTTNTISLTTAPLEDKNIRKEYNYTITNNGHSIILEPSTDESLLISGGGLPGTFVLFQFHFHWDSEHTIDGDRKAFEAHYVAYNNKFDKPEEALKFKNGIAVVTVLYEFSDEDNENLAPIVDEIGNLKKVRQSSTTTLNIKNLLPDDTKNFYRYWGSLTTPDCNDVVVWTIFKETCEISQAQVDKFATIQDLNGDTLTKNYRKIQPLNGRNVYEISTE